MSDNDNIDNIEMDTADFIEQMADAAVKEEPVSIKEPVVDVKATGDENSEDVDDVDIDLFDDLLPNPRVTMRASPFLRGSVNVRGMAPLTFPVRTWKELVDALDKCGEWVPGTDEKPPEFSSEYQQELYIKYLETSELAQDRHYGNMMSMPNEYDSWQQGAGKTDDGAILGARALRPASRELLKHPVKSILSQLGLADYILVPLWNSGIYVYLNQPSDRDLMALTRRLAKAKVDLRRQLGGRMFSNMDAYIRRVVVDFAFNKLLFKTTVNGLNASNISKYLVESDVPALIRGLGAAIYPRGYDYSQPCLGGKDGCTHVKNGYIDINLMDWVNFGALTEFQRKHLRNRQPDSVSIDDVVKYQSEFNNSAQYPTGVKITTPVGDAYISFKKPTHQDSYEIGDQWLSSIVEMADDVLTKYSSESERKDFIAEQAMATSMLQYVQWIDSLSHAAGDEKITDRDDIYTAVLRLCDDTNALTTLTNAVERYIEQSNVSYVGIPVYTCPSCKEEVSEEYKQHPQLYGIDPYKLFFNLRQQKISLKLAMEQYRMLGVSLTSLTETSDEKSS